MAGIRKAAWIPVAVAVAAVKIFSLFPEAVEKYYSMGFYPVISRVLRLLFGWVPFSIGDLFYVGMSCWLLWKLIRFLRLLRQRKIDRAWLGMFVYRSFLFIMWVYLSFNLLWGLNYNRAGIAAQLQLEVKPYTTDELQTVLTAIVMRMNETDSAAHANRNTLDTHHRLFSGAAHAYDTLAGQQPFFAYSSPSVKSSLFSTLGDYFGFTGYYNPFTGEAQVNTTVPVFVLPFTTCHEIGHQLGYAKENEANFAGYLAAKSSPDPVYRYSAYFDLYQYAARELYLRDSNRLIILRNQLHPSIRKDYRELRAFFARYENPFEPLIRVMYGNYLRANEQPQGILSYNAVTACLVAYFKKFGPVAI